MKNFVKTFIADESGATAIEYGLLAALIAVVIIGGASVLGSNLDTLFRKVAACLQDSKSTACTA